MGVLAQQRLVLVLAVDIHQQAAQRPEVGERAGLAIDVGPGAPVAADDPAQDAVVVVIKFMAFQPCPRFWYPGNVEGGGDVCTLGAVADSSGVSAIAQGQAQGVQHDGFAGAGLPGQCRHALAELQFDSFGDGVVGHGELCEHGWPPLPRGPAAGCAVARVDTVCLYSIWKYIQCFCGLQTEEIEIRHESGVGRLKPGPGAPYRFATTVFRRASAGSKVHGRVVWPLSF